MAGRQQLVERRKRTSELAELRTEMRSGFKRMHAGFKAVRAEMAAGLEEVRGSSSSASTVGSSSSFGR